MKPYGGQLRAQVAALGGSEPKVYVTTPGTPAAKQQPCSPAAAQ